MYVLVTGAAGLIGSNIMVALLHQGYSVLATDINPLPPVVLDQIAQYSDKFQEVIGDLTKIAFVDELFDSVTGPLDGIMHIGGIRSPVGMDPRLVHNINVVATYNVLQTAAVRGVKRLVQASSCNALGLSWTSREHWHLDSVPLNEKSATIPEDPYSLSKLICEEQAAAIQRYYPETRFATIRMHFTRSSMSDTTSSAKPTGLWSWSSVDAVVRACILGLSSEGWTGAEVFHIASDEIFYADDADVSAMDLLERTWKGRVRNVDKDWWAGNPRRSFFDTSKAQAVLGWKHDL